MNYQFEPKISILTPSYNQGAYIEDNIKSVKNQTYRRIEHVIIDGSSMDNTIDILRKYDHLKWISAADSGQSEAYNKGIQMIAGDFVLCLNSDDYLLSETIISEFVTMLEKVRPQEYSAIMGNTIVVNERGEKITEMHNRGIDLTFDILLNKLPIVIHPATFFKANILKEVGGFANDIHYVMDYDIFLKVSKIAPIKTIPLFVSALRRHNQAKGFEDNSWKFSWEFLKLRHKYGGNYFNKMNLQPILKILLKLTLGNKLITWAKEQKKLKLLANRLGLSKFRGLIWYDNRFNRM